MKNKESYVKATVVLRVRTANAIKIDFNDSDTEWVPRSTLSYSCDQAIDQLMRGEEFELIIAEWKASEIGLQY